MKTMIFIICLGFLFSCNENSKPKSSEEGSKAVSNNCDIHFNREDSEIDTAIKAYQVREVCKIATETQLVAYLEKDIEK